MVKCGKCGKEEGLSYIGKCRNSEFAFSCGLCGEITYKGKFEDD